MRIRLDRCYSSCTENIIYPDKHNDVSPMQAHNPVLKWHPEPIYNKNTPLDYPDSFVWACLLKQEKWACD